MANLAGVSECQVHYNGQILYLSHKNLSSHNSLRLLKLQAIRLHSKLIWIQHCAYDRLTECQGNRGHPWGSWPAFAASCPASTRQTPSRNLKYMFYINEVSSCDFDIKSSGYIWRRKVQSKKLGKKNKISYQATVQD